MVGALAFGGCDGKKGIVVMTSPKTPSGEGGITFKDLDNNVDYRDTGFDGTLDRVSYYDKEKEEWVKLCKGDKGFDDHVPGYLKTRRKVTEGDLE